MADAKITALTELTTPAGADLLAVVDDVAGTATTKKATLTNTFDALRPIAYGSISFNSNVTGTTLTSNTWAAVNMFDTDGAASGTTPAHGSNQITVTEAGVYVISWSLNFLYTTAAGVDVSHQVAVAIDGTQDQSSQQTMTQPRTTGVHSGSAVIARSLSASDVLTLTIRPVGQDTTPIFGDGQLVVWRVA